MNTATAEKRGPGRPKRQEQERRRRKDRGGIIGQRLGVNESLLDFDNFAYRWINDDPARIMAKTKEDDWDIVRQDGTDIIKDEAETDAAIFQIVGTNADGSPKRAYLCRKPRAWYKEDQADKVKELERQLAEMRRGNAADGSAQSDYVPNEGIRI